MSNIAVLATNVIKMTEWPAYKMARDLANGKVFPVSETVIMQTACKHGIGPDGEAVAGGLILFQEVRKLLRLYPPVHRSLLSQS